jgi:hypothetical protein
VEAFRNFAKGLLAIKSGRVNRIHPASYYGTVSYSQEGEDLILQRFIGNTKKGFYIDIGAHHPFRFSNTYHFYKQGWHGINVDAMPGSMNAFKKLRPRDINLEIPVSESKQVLTYYIFNEPALNTFSGEEARKKNGLRDYKVVEELRLQTFPLSYILDKYLPQNTLIDFLSIDVEGLDYSVLSSNNWEKYQPSIILIESLQSSLENLRDNEMYAYLHALNYRLIAKTLNTLFFQKS